MAKIKQALIDEHIKMGCPCPECGSEMIEGQEVNIEGPTATQECFCTACYAEWIDSYKLEKVTITAKSEK